LPQKKNDRGPQPVQTIAKIQWTATEPIKTETDGPVTPEKPVATGFLEFFNILNINNYLILREDFFACKKQ
jgi:hypothetical protein